MYHIAIYSNDFIPEAPGDPFLESVTLTSIEFKWTSPSDAGRSNGNPSLSGYGIKWDNGVPTNQLTDLATITNPS